MQADQFAVIEDARRSSSTVLLCVAGRYRCALPLLDVVEIMRPLAIESLPNVPEFVRGAGVIRGEIVPVIDVSMLLGDGPGQPGRFVTVHTGRRVVALVVDGVLGVRDVGADCFTDLPPLLSQVDPGVATGVGRLEAGLLLLLGASRSVSEALWDQLDGQLVGR